MQPNNAGTIFTQQFYFKYNLEYKIQEMQVMQFNFRIRSLRLTSVFGYTWLAETAWFLVDDDRICIAGHFALVDFDSIS